MIPSRTTSYFRQAFKALPPHVRELARKAYGQFKENPFHPSLHFKKVYANREVYSVRVGLDHRALGAMRSGRIVWFWIGHHSDYDRRI